jgi:hypothetical protein
MVLMAIRRITEKTLGCRGKAMFLPPFSAAASVMPYYGICTRRFHPSDIANWKYVAQDY